MKQDLTLKLLLTTIGFGVGMNCPDVDMVVMWGAPNSLMEYWQLVGRAGRDGRPCSVSISSISYPGR